MEQKDIQPRIPLAELIPAWGELSLARRAQIESQVNQEWWRGWYEGREAERVECPTDASLATLKPLLLGLATA